MTDLTGATLTSSSYGDPRRNAPGLGLYQRLPERSNWTEFEVWTLADGTTVRRERSCARWAGTEVTGDWREVSAFVVSYSSKSPITKVRTASSDTVWATSGDEARKSVSLGHGWDSSFELVGVEPA